MGVIENMSAFTAPDGQRYAIFGEGGGQELADELDVPLLAKVPLEEALREHADGGDPLVASDPNAASSIAIHEAARGIIAQTPVELPLMEAVAASVPEPVGAPVSGMELPVVQAGS
jgi:ATP-binding protein involved in chromosome partitioning